MQPCRLPLGGAIIAGHVTAEKTQNVTHFGFMGGEDLIHRSGASRLGEGEAHADFYAISRFLKAMFKAAGKVTTAKCLGSFFLSL